MRLRKWQRILGRLRWVTLLLTIIYAFTAGISLQYYRAWVLTDAKDFFQFVKADSAYLIFIFALLFLLIFMVYIQFNNFYLELQLGKTHLMTIFDSSPMVIIAVGLDGIITDWNPCATRIFEMSYSEAIKISYAELMNISAEEQATFIALVRENKSVAEYTIKRVRKDGAVLTLNGSITPMVDVNSGVVIGMLVDLLDVTEYRKMEDELRYSEKRYRDLVENVNGIIIKLDSQGDIIFWNRYAAEFFGYSETEIIGKPLLETVLPEVATDGLTGAELLDILLSASPQNRGTIVIENIDKNGKRVWVAWASYSGLDNEGKMEVICIGSDVTAQREAEDRQLLMAKRAEAVITAADILLNCTSEDEVTFRAVVLARELLGLERCSIALVEDETLQMTYGTDMNGQTTDEHATVQPVTREHRQWLEAIHLSDKHNRFEERNYLEAVEGSYRELEAGQLALTPLVSGVGLLGVFYNDNAIDGKPLDDDQQGSVVLFCSVLANIIERIRTEKELEHERFLLQTLLDNIPDYIYFKDRHSRFTRVSKSMAGLFGVSVNKVIGKTDFDFFTDIFAQKTFGDELRMMEEGHSLVNMEEMQTWRNGAASWVNSAKLPLLGPDGTVIGTFGISHNITEKKEAENLQRTLLMGLQAVLDIADELLSSASVDELLRRAVVMASERLGLERTAIMLQDNNGKLCGTYATGADGKIVDISDQCISLEEHQEKIEKMRIKHNRWFTLENVAGSPGYSKHSISAMTPFQVGERAGVFSNDNALSGGMLNPEMQDVVSVYVSLLGDILLHKQTEEVLFAEMERLAVTLKCIGDGVITTDKAGNIVMLNKVAEYLTGWLQQDAAGLPLEKVFSIVDYKTRTQLVDPVDRVITSGHAEALNARTLLLSKNGQEREIEDSGAPILDRNNAIIGVVLVFRDVTNERRVEEELAKADKLESVGVLAGGIAHDFNNILTAIVGNISLALSHQEGGSDAELLINVEKAALRARDLTQQLLTFARGGAPVKNLMALEELVTETTRFALSGTNVRCEFDFPVDLWPVEADAGQIHQVLNNLTINAVQAMPGGGVLKVSAENYIISEKDLLSLPEGKYTRVGFSDTGCGVKPEIKALIFDPYFTTKDNGTGLGLATAYSIMRHHDGDVTVENHPDVGATFYLYFPATTGETPAKSSMNSIIIPAHGKIMVMDDDDIVCEVVGNMLEHLGYHVVLVSDGTHAITHYLESLATGDPFDVLIMDLTVPGGMGGKETISDLLALDPTVKAIVSSGYSTDPVMANYRSYGFAGVIAKPYQLAELDEVVRKVMGAE